MSRLYNATEKGFPGDEDQGGLSSWCVLSALDIYSVCPGTDQYVIGSPMFEKASIALENGSIFKIDAIDNGQGNVYILSVDFNGHTLTRSWITYDEIMKGGVLKFNMGGNRTRHAGLTMRIFRFPLLPLDGVPNDMAVKNQTINQRSEFHRNGNGRR